MDKILVVEDELLIAMQLEVTLLDAGYQVLGPAQNIACALELLRNERPAAAILDVNLAGDRITPVAILLKSIGVPFMLASGYRGQDLEDEVLQDVLNLGKPTVMDELLRELRVLLAPGSDD